LIPRAKSVPFPDPQQPVTTMSKKTEQTGARLRLIRRIAIGLTVVI
jgi:hypothetical protein